MDSSQSGNRPRHEWRFSDWIVIRRIDLRPNEREEFANPDFLVERWLEQPAGPNQIEQMLRWAGFVSSEANPIAMLDPSERLEDDVIEAFRRRYLVLLRRARQSMGGAGADAAQGDAGAAPKKKKKNQEQQEKGPEKTWVEFRLLDTEGNPVAGARYRMRITDGSVRTGSLDEDGRVRVSGIDPGNCDICFMDFDAREWKPR